MLCFDSTLETRLHQGALDGAFENLWTRVELTVAFGTSLWGKCLASCCCFCLYLAFISNPNMDWEWPLTPIISLQVFAMALGILH